MKKALISPMEKIYDENGLEIGIRIAQISDNEFDVAPPLYWIDCSDDITDVMYYYDEKNKTIIKIPEIDITINFDDLF